MDQLLISLDIENIGKAMELASSDLSVTQVTTISRTCTTQLIRSHKQGGPLVLIIMLVNIFNMNIEQISAYSLGNLAYSTSKASRSVWNSKKSEDRSTEELYVSDMPLGDKYVRHFILSYFFCLFSLFRYPVILSLLHIC